MLGEESEAPTLARLVYEHGQDTLIDYRTDHVIRRVIAGPRPMLALNVTFWWPKTEDGPSRYSFNKDQSGIAPDLLYHSHCLSIFIFPGNPCPSGYSLYPVQLNGAVNMVDMEMGFLRNP